MDLPVMPPVDPMLAKSTAGIPPLARCSCGAVQLAGRPCAVLAEAPRALGDPQLAAARAYCADRLAELGYSIDNIFRFFRIDVTSAFLDGKYEDFRIQLGITTDLISFR